MIVDGRCKDGGCLFRVYSFCRTFANTLVPNGSLYSVPILVQTRLIFTLLTVGDKLNPSVHLSMKTFH